MGPPPWAQRALTKGGEVAGGLGDWEAVCIHTCIPTHTTVSGPGSGCLRMCVCAHCSGWEESGHQRSVFDPLYARLRAGGPSCGLSLDRGSRVLQRPSPTAPSPGAVPGLGDAAAGPLLLFVGRSGSCQPK